MKRFLSRIAAGCLAALLCAGTLATPALAADDCTEEKLELLLLPRGGEPLAHLAAAAGLAADDYALTEAGAAALAESAEALDALLARAAEVCHCCLETARWQTALLGLAVTVDAADYPYLLAEGDLAPAGEAFDVILPATYAALSDPTPDLVLNVVEQEITPSVFPPRGSGSVIALLDTGFSLEAGFLTLPEAAVPALSGEALDARLALVGREGVCLETENEKIPFAYNYADPGGALTSSAQHGTRIAALAAADYNGGEYDGSAPGAQLLCMKVFGEVQALGAKEADLLSAVDDALLLGADIINLSLGAADHAGKGLALAISAAEASGVGVVCAAGNTGETGPGSQFYNIFGQTLYPTDSPDRGTIISPASEPGSFAVGAASGSYTDALYFTDSEGERIPYTDTCAEYFTDSDGRGAGFASLLGTDSLTYRAIPGIGSSEDFAGLDLTGRVALIRRGTISFVEKAANAAAAGAIGVIVYDNDPETDGAVRMELTDAVLPAVFIGIDDGERLAQAGDGVLHFPDDSLSSRGMTVRKAADFSSRGMRDDFSFAPALLALGDNFIGLSSGDALAELSGTSYAAAQVSGALAALLGRIRTEGLSEAAGAAEMAETMLQNAASPLSDNGIPVSVRVQGAGVLNLDAALRAPLLLSGNDGGAITLTGAGQQFILDFTIRNLTDHPQTFTLSPALYADEYTTPNLDELDSDAAGEIAAWLDRYGYGVDGESLPLCVTGRLRRLAAAFSLDGSPVGDSGIVLTLEAGESREVSLAVELDGAAYAEYAKAFSFGFTVEGRISVTSDRAPALSLPFAVFCGDWTTAPLLSADAYSQGAQLYPNQAIYAPLRSGNTVCLGERDEGGGVTLPGMSAACDSRFTSFNPGSLSAPLFFTAYLLRSVERYTVSVTDAAGEEIYSHTENGPLTKARNLSGMAEAAIIPLWDGSAGDNAKYICPDGEYAITLTLYGQAGGEQCIRFPSIRIDTEMPSLTDAVFRWEGERLMLDLTLDDAEYLRTVYLADRRGYIDYDYSFFAAEKTLERGRGATVLLPIDATLMAEQYLYITVIDYAYNTVVIRLDRDAMFAEFTGNF